MSTLVAERVRVGSVAELNARGCTLVSAGGTLLNASAGFSLYGNLYIGPMTEAIAALLARLDGGRERLVNGSRFVAEQIRAGAMSRPVEEGRA